MVSPSIRPRLAPRCWIVPPAYDHWYLDGYCPLVIQQCGVNHCWSRGKAGRSLPCKSNGVTSEHTAWQYPSLKDIKLDKWTCPRITGGAGERWACPGCTKQWPWHIHGNLLYYLLQWRQYYRWTHCPRPKLPPVTRTNLVQVLQGHCSWFLIAIHPGCPTLLWCALWRIYCPLNSSKYCPQAKTAPHRWPGLPTLDLPIELRLRQELCPLCTAG